MIKDRNFITIQGWMLNELHLSGNELITYAVIYHFSQDGMSVFHGSAAYLAEWCGMSRRKIYDVLRRLINKGLIEKIDRMENRVLYCDYRVIPTWEKGENTPIFDSDERSGGCDETSGGGMTKGHRGYDQRSHHNKDENKEINIEKKENCKKEKKDENDFENFWGKYEPVTCRGRTVPKGSKKLAYERWLVAIRKSSPADIISGLGRYLDFCKNNDILTCSAPVFLSQERWKDTYATKKKEFYL